jgi:hypothetical protein
LKISKELTDLMKEPTKNWWFRVLGSLTLFFAFLEPEGCANGQDGFYDVRTCSLILRTNMPVQDRHMHYLYSSVPGSNKVTTEKLQHCLCHKKQCQIWLYGIKTLDWDWVLWYFTPWWPLYTSVQGPKAQEPIWSKLNLELNPSSHLKKHSFSRYNECV